MAIPFVRTPDERFENLPGYPFAPNYAEVDGLRMHYVDENPDGKEVILLLHGEPSWSYLYRKMIPVLVAGGYRVIAPDLIGFGRSDKPTQQSDYTYARHLAWLKELVFEHLKLEKFHLFVQDWGGLLGLRIVAEHPDSLLTVTAGNTGLPTGDQQMPDAFLAWQKASQTMDPFPVEVILQRATVSELSPEILAAYNAPHPDETYKAGAKIFPALVPTTPEDPENANNKAAWASLMKFEKPFLTLFSDSDPVTKGGEMVMQKLIPGTKGQPHEIIKQGGHFLQEDKGEEIAEKMLAFIAST